MGVADFDILFRIIGYPVTDNGEQEHIPVRNEMVSLHKVGQPVQRILAMMEIGALNMDRSIKSGRTDVIAGETGTGRS